VQWAVADFNQDGWPDIVATGFLKSAVGASGYVSVLLNRGSEGSASAGMFTGPTEIASAATNANHFYAVTTADFNGDNYPDVAATAQTSASVVVMLNATPSNAVIETSTVRVTSSNRFRLKVNCHTKATKTCAGKIEVRRLQGQKRALVKADAAEIVASGRFNLRAGRHTVELAVRRAALKELRRVGYLDVVAQTSTRQLKGQADAAHRQTVRLKARG
jgi:hypothetical protein